MIDIKLVKENPKLVKENLKKKFQKDKEKIVDELIKVDSRWRKLKYDEDKLRASRNKISKAVGEAKKAKDEKKAKELMKKAKEIPDKISKSEDKRKKLEEKIRELQIEIPNIMSKNVPIGEDDSKNVVEKIIGKPKKFSFDVKSHIDIAEKLEMIDFDSSARVAGNGFYYLEGDLALLNVALAFIKSLNGFCCLIDALQQVFHETVPATGGYWQAGQPVRAVCSQESGVEFLFHQLAEIAHQGQAQATHIVHVLLGQRGQLAGTEQLSPLQLASVLGQVAPQVAEVWRSLQGQAALGQDCPVAPV